MVGKLKFCYSRNRPGIRQAKAGEDVTVFIVRRSGVPMTSDTIS